MRKLAYCAGGFSAAIFLAHFLLPVRWVLPGALAAVVLALVTLLLPGQTRRRVMVALLSAAIGFGWYAAATAMRLTPAQNVSGDVQTVTARVTEYPVAYERSYGLTVVLTSPNVPDCKARLYVSDAGAADLHPGDEITADVKLRPSTLRYGEETDSYISKGIYLIGSVQDKTLERTGVWSRSWLYWPKTVAQSLKASAQTAFPADVLPFAQALMLGDKSALYAQDLDIPLSTTGIMHTVAVSGLHLAFLLGFLRLFTGNRRTTAIIGLPLMVVFVVMAGCSPSVLRAAFMTALLLFAPLLGRENDPPTSLLTALAYCSRPTRLPRRASVCSSRLRPWRACFVSPVRCTARLMRGCCPLIQSSRGRGERSAPFSVPQRRAPSAPWCLPCRLRRCISAIFRSSRRLQTCSFCGCCRLRSSAAISRRCSALSGHGAAWPLHG